MKLISQSLLALSIASLSDAVLFKVEYPDNGRRETQEAATKRAGAAGRVRGRRRSSLPLPRNLKQEKGGADDECTTLKFDIRLAEAQENSYVDYAGGAADERLPGDFDAITIPLYQYNTRKQVGIFIQTTQYLPGNEGIGNQVYSLDFDEELGQYTSVVSAAATASSNVNGIYAGSGRFDKSHGFAAGFDIETREDGDAVAVPVVTVCKD